MTIDEKCPLVSIIVVTYNSSKYIIETLNSSKAQLYKNIELIITDDCSKDGTLDLCHSWIEENKSRFHSASLITSNINSGITPNFNRGLYAAKGEWVKFIAGDDILLDNCISTNINLVKGTSNCRFVFTQMNYTNNETELINHFNKGYELFQKEHNQLKILLRKNYLPAPTAFMHRETLVKLNGFDERFPMVEDYPFWIKVVKNNYKIQFFDVETVTYRVHDESISFNRRTKQKHIFYTNFLFLKSWFKFQKIILLKEQFLNGFILRGLNNLIDIIHFEIVRLFNNKKNFASIFLWNLFSLVKPSFYKNLIKTRFSNK